PTQCGFDHFLRRLNSTHRRTTDFRGLEEICFRDSRTQRHHVYAVRAVLIPKCFGKRKHECLRCRIRGHVWNSLEGGGRSDIDDRAALSFAHRQQKTMRQIDEGSDVELKHFEFAIQIEFAKSPIEPKPALLMSMSISSSRFC